MTMRSSKKYLILPAVFAFVSAAALRAQDSPPPTPPPAPDVETSATPLAASPGESVDKIVGNFFALLTKNQVDQAYDYLVNGTKIAEDSDEVVNLKAKTKDAIKVCGDIQGYEQVVVQNVGTHLMRSTYISLGTAFPMRWKFYFYRVDRTWKLIDIRIDDGLVEMFDDNQPQKQSQPTGTGQ